MQNCRPFLYFDAERIRGCERFLSWSGFPESEVKPLVMLLCKSTEARAPLTLAQRKYYPHSKTLADNASNDFE